MLGACQTEARQTELKIQYIDGKGQGIGANKEAGVTGARNITCNQELVDRTLVVLWVGIG